MLRRKPALDKLGKSLPKNLASQQVSRTSRNISVFLVPKPRRLRGTGDIGNENAGKSFRASRTWARQSCKTITHALITTQKVRKSRLEQLIPNESSIIERWRYLVHFYVTFPFQDASFIHRRGFAFSGPYRWNFRKVRDFVYFIDPFIVHSCLTRFIFAARTLDFAVKFRFVFRYEAVVFKRYVLALLSARLLKKNEAYLV